VHVRQSGTPHDRDDVQFLRRAFGKDGYAGSVNSQLPRVRHERKK